MNYLLPFLVIAGIHLLAVISPGPDFAIVTKNSLLYSRRVGIMTALGVAIGIIIHVTYSLLGVGLLIAQSILLFSIIKYIGAAYLIYIGIQALRSKPHTDTLVQLEQKDVSYRKAFANGFLTNALNPKATLFFLALFTQVIDPTTPLVIQGLYGLEMVMITFVWFSFLALMLSSQIIKSRIVKVQHHVEHITGVALIALGIKVALSHK